MTQKERQTLFKIMDYAATLHGVTLSEKRKEAYAKELENCTKELLQNAFRHCIDNINTFPAISDIKAYINAEREKSKKDIEVIKDALQEVGKANDKRHNFKYKEGGK